MQEERRGSEESEEVRRVRKVRLERRRYEEVKK
jgi:hypothetical protein